MLGRMGHQEKAVAGTRPVRGTQNWGGLRSFPHHTLWNHFRLEQAMKTKPVKEHPVKNAALIMNQDQKP